MSVTEERLVGRLTQEFCGARRSLCLQACRPLNDRRAIAAFPTHRSKLRMPSSISRAQYSSRGGRLVFGGHPSISPLVAMVAGEYVFPHAAEPGTERPAPPVIIHQLDIYRPEVPDATLLMERLGQAAVVWHHTEPAEGHLRWDRSTVPYPRSLARMRGQMLADPAIAAMVCIGGMEGVEDEVRLFLQLRQGQPLYLLARSGGATALLANQLRATKNVRVIDDELLNDIRPRLRAAHGETADAPLRYTPYPFIMQRIVREIAELK